MATENLKHCLCGSHCVSVGGAAAEQRTLYTVNRARKAITSSSNSPRNLKIYLPDTFVGDLVNMLIFTKQSDTQKGSRDLVSLREN